MYLKIYTFLASIFCLVLISTTSAQNNLYTPLNIQQAYDKGTRNYDGTPGINYWQNSADYNIEAEFDPQTRLLSGKETITYFNNSPDTLQKLVIRLYQNFYRYGASRDFQIQETALSKGVDIIKVIINGEVIDPSDSKKLRRFATNISLVPSTPVTPNSKNSIEIEWSFTVPGGYPIRMGTYDSTTYFIAYWYPQISVYDDIDGWDEYNFGGEHEFYNDFNNFDVKITVPADQGVWATGMLQNPADVLQPEYYERYNLALNSDTVVRIITLEDINDKPFNTSKVKNTWRFIAENVPDFAFATSDHYLWDGVSIQPDDKQERRVFLSAVYNPASEDFYNVASIALDVIKYFSFELPGVPYPYPALTVFNGSGGMEFPMIINDGTEKVYSETLSLTAHESAHQYFPFFTGVNERKYAWMDEGMAVMIPFDLQERNGGHNRTTNTRVYTAFAGRDIDMPLMIPSIMSKGSAYRNAAYSKPGTAFRILENTLGKELFRQALQEFIRRWNGKHPIPFDFFYTFNETAGEDLGWFWNPWFFERGYPDIALKNVIKDNNIIKVTVEKIGNIPIPVHLTVEGNNGTVKEIYKAASVWKTGEKQITIEEEIDFEPSKVTAGSEIIPDVEPENNIYIIN